MWNLSNQANKGRKRETEKETLNAENNLVVSWVEVGGKMCEIDKGNSEYTYLDEHGAMYRII